MSYSILLKEKDKETTEILFSTNTFYENYWLELSRELNLPLIGEFQYGVEIQYHELQDLLREVLKVEIHLKNKNSNNDNEKKILDRIDYIRKEIGKIDFDKIIIKEIYIG